MAIYANASNQIAALKELYAGGDYMQNLVYKQNPLLAMLPKDESAEGFAGKYIPVPVITAGPAGRSANFANAQTNQTAPVDLSFFVYRTKNYQLATIENELLEATASDAGAFLKASQYIVDTAIRNIVNDIAHDLYSDGTGSRGQIASISTGVITLVDASTVVNFEIGMTLVSYSVSGNTATQSTGTALGYVIGVNRTAGTVTVSASVGGAAGTPTNWSTTFLNLAVQGDVNFASNGLLIANGSAQKLSGLAAWLPKVAPTTGDSFWGIDRSVDQTRLGGLRFDGSAYTIEEALIDAAALASREGAFPSMCFINFASYAALVKGLGAKVQYVDVSHADAKVSFQGVTILGDYGPITVVPDRSCIAQTAYILDMDTWKLRTLNKAPHLLTYGAEGLDGIRVSNADALEMRWGLYGNLVCNAPGRNIVVSLSQ